MTSQKNINNISDGKAFRSNVTHKLVKPLVTMSKQISKLYSFHMSRAESTSSHRPSSPLTVMEVRKLTDNYQKMLIQATQEIKKLNIQKTKLEKEQEKLLIVNIELATEAKRLVKDVKEGKQEKEVHFIFTRLSSAIPQSI